MSMPSIEDEVWTYWTNEVEANCPTPSDKYRMAYKVLENRCVPSDQYENTEQKYCIQELIEHYIETKDISDLVHLIADALRNKEIDYD